ncbi:MAG TPA: hypothetical protein VG097_06005 [Gemmata sp.]|nr:hypothetical protein [Gemmata sp.]
MKRFHAWPFGLFASVLCVGCGSSGDQPTFPELSPVHGLVKRGGQPVSGGMIQFSPEPNTPEFLINSPVGGDGTYSLSTVRTTDRGGERKSGAPAGSYKIRYTPPTNTKDVAALAPVEMMEMVSIKPGDNELTIELPAKR